MVKNSAQLAVVNGLVTHERIAERVVHDMARAIADNLDRLPAMNPLFKGLKKLFEPLRTKVAAAFEFGGVDLHPGAARAYREMGYLKRPVRAAYYSFAKSSASALIKKKSPP